MLGSALCLFLLAACSLASSTHQPQVKTSLGLVKGRIQKSRGGRDYFAFTGIPYARPPVGRLRFKPPVPADQWNGVLDGTKTSPKCPQRPDQEVIGQEDCLYMNIFSPNVNASLPVLLHVHGGAFLIGPEVVEAGPEMGAFFMDQDVVLVTLQYRLGILGFLSLENDELPGNMGLKDMALSLEWLRKEVRNFGGNPELISAFGISAGGAATHYLCLAPRTRKLLKGCISGSGVGGSEWSLNKKGEAKAVAMSMAERFQCPEDDLVSCLQSKPINELILPYVDTIQTGFQPSIEPVSKNAMITEWPPRDTNFPWVIGHTANEGILTTAVLANFENQSALKPYVEDWRTFFPELLRLKTNNESKAKRVHDRFFIDQDPYTAIEQLISEALFFYPALKEAVRHTGPKYFYVFNYTGGPSMWELVTNMTLNITGVGHCDDTPYLFNIPNGYKPEGWPSPKDVKMSKELVGSWVKFAKTQNPRLDNRFPWMQFNRGQYLDIANKGVRMKNYRKMNEIINFWDSIFD